MATIEDIETDKPEQKTEESPVDETTKKAVDAAQSLEAELKPDDSSVETKEEKAPEETPKQEEKKQEKKEEKKDKPGKVANTVDDIKEVQNARITEVIVTCSACDKTYDMKKSGKVCPHCGTVRRGRNPAGYEPDETKAAKEKVDNPKEGPPKPGFDKRKKPRFTLEDLNRPMNSFEESMANMPVMAIHMTLIKKRGWGITTEEAEQGGQAFGMLVRKYSTELVEYMPELMCLGWIAKAVIMPDIRSKEEYEKYAEEMDKKKG